MPRYDNYVSSCRYLKRDPIVNYNRVIEYIRCQIVLLKMLCLVNKIQRISSKTWVSSQNEKKKNNNVADLSASILCKYMHFVFFWTHTIFWPIFAMLSSGLCFSSVLSMATCRTNDTSKNHIRSKAVLYSNKVDRKRNKSRLVPVKFHITECSIFLTSEPLKQTTHDLIFLC